MGLTCPWCHALCLFTCLSGVSWPLSVCLFSELNSSFCVSLSDVSCFSCLWTLLWMSEWWNSQISSWRMKRRRRRSRRSFWFSVPVHSEHRSLCGDFYPEGVTDSSPYPSCFPFLPLPLLCVSLHVLAIHFLFFFWRGLEWVFYCVRVQTNNKTKTLSCTHHWWFYLTETDFKKIRMCLTVKTIILA